MLPSQNNSERFGNSKRADRADQQTFSLELVGSAGIPKQTGEEGLQQISGAVFSSVDADFHFRKNDEAYFDALLADFDESTLSQGVVNTTHIQKLPEEKSHQQHIESPSAAPFDDQIQSKIQLTSPTTQHDLQDTTDPLAVVGGTTTYQPTFQEPNSTCWIISISRNFLILEEVQQNIGR